MYKLKLATTMVLAGMVVGGSTMAQEVNMVELVESNPIANYKLVESGSEQDRVNSLTVGWVNGELNVWFDVSVKGKEFDELEDMAIIKADDMQLNYGNMRAYFNWDDQEDMDFGTYVDFEYEPWYDVNKGDFVSPTIDVSIYHNLFGEYVVSLENDEIITVYFEDGVATSIEEIAIDENNWDGNERILLLNKHNHYYKAIKRNK